MCVCVHANYARVYTLHSQPVHSVGLEHHQIFLVVDKYFLLIPFHLLMILKTF